jgi:hypothetical protein
MLPSHTITVQLAFSANTKTEVTNHGATKDVTNYTQGEENWEFEWERAIFATSPDEIKKSKKLQ